MADAKKTGSDTHRATQRGYAVDQKTGAGVLVEEGELVPAGIPVSENWMEPVKNVKGLSKDDLVTAVKAADEPTL
jgi:hypothetical protein